MVALFPTLKLQIEHWFTDGYFNAEIKERLELKAIENGMPARVTTLARSPLSVLPAVQTISMVATNLRVWTSEDDLAFTSQPHFPVPGSEWHAFLGWLGGHTPTAPQWAGASTYFSNVGTCQLLELVLHCGIRWHALARLVLARALDGIDRECRGLPFMNDLFELTADGESLPLLQEKKVLVRPRLLGKTTIWPTLSGAGDRLLLSDPLPVVALRPRFDDGCVQDATTVRVRFFFPAPSVPRTSTRVLPSEDFRNANAGSRAPMQNVCPVCYTKIKDKYANWAEVWCVMSLSKVNNQEHWMPSGHRSQSPTGENERGEQIPWPYLEVPHERVRSVTLAGMPQHGKTTWLYSCLGSMDFPVDDSHFTSFFPESWLIRTQSLKLTYDERQNVRALVERFWARGELPTANPLYERALRSPWKICRSRRRGWLGAAGEEEMVCVFNDLPGELLTTPQAYNRDSWAAELFRHLEYATDLVYLVDLSQDRFAIFKQFLEAITAKRGRADALRKTNLIVVFSQIDKLMDRDDEQYRLLYETAIGQQPRLPRSRDEDEFRGYLSDMARVDNQLRDWCERNTKDFWGVASHAFRKIRFCGSSALGAAPIGVSLPFAPIPVRVFDPLLWIMIEHGFIGKG
jgi:hypothetical protein